MKVGARRADRAEAEHRVDEGGDEDSQSHLVPDSRTKFRIMRGPNCWDARVNARIVIENTTPTTVMTAAAMAISTCRPASGFPVSNRIHVGRVRSW